MFSNQGTAAARAREYATETDFCRVFDEQMNRFFFLSLLLTGDEQEAELCLMQSLESCKQSRRVFREWAERWATHSIIRSAIQIVEPTRLRPLLPPEIPDELTSDPESMLATLRTFPALDRFIYVMSTLEKYSDRECASFLGCSPRGIPLARARAFRQLGRVAESFRLEWTSEPLRLRKIS